MLTKSCARVAILLVFSLSVLIAADGNAAQPPASLPKLQLKAVRTDQPPVIDGDLSDAAWQAAPEITGFIQHNPEDGKPATRPTVVRILYDDAAIYFGARMDDPDAVTNLLGRRDSDLASDWLRISIDSQHDGMNAADFRVNPSNVQVDAILYDDISDDWSWDAVWNSAARIVPGGWVAEMRIPFSQLRFAAAAEQTWGINFERTIISNGETDRLVNTPKGETGFVSRFADLIGVEAVQRGRSLEIIPYGVTRSDLTSRTEAADPFTRPADYGVDAGVDLKYALTSQLTLTGTINPDFGQVEVDPAVVNLSEFETFFPEKRPFFTEGAQLFRFGSGPAYGRWNFNFGSPTWFYTRRIGRSPQSTARGADYADQPHETTILGAAKLTGKLGRGWSVGVLDALTDAERGSFLGCRNPDENGACSATRWSETVEPMTNYFVGRSTKDFGSNSRIGFLLMSTTRRLPSELSSLRTNGWTGGVDGYTFFHGRDWLFEWLGGGTRVEGSAQAIAATQRNAAHHFNRPDARNLRYDPTRTSLTGWGGRATLGRQTGRWRPNLQIQTYSPGFEVNDAGYVTRGDIISTHALVHYTNEELREHVRETSFWVGKYQNWNFDRDLIANGVHGAYDVEFLNYWTFSAFAGAATSRFDDRRTRGGPLVRLPSERNGGFSVETDETRPFAVELSTEYATDAIGGDYRSSAVDLNYRPTAAIRLSLEPSFSSSREVLQYVTTIPDPDATATFGRRYVFATLDQKTLDIGTRAEWTVSSRLSFQLFLQPFIASGGYHDFKELARPRSGDYTLYGRDLAFDSNDNSYRVSREGKQFAFGNPDFNVRSVRGSAVLRWELRPGSSLYVVWNENREDVVPIGDFRLRRDFSALPDALSHDVFLVKLSYWIGM